MELVQNSTNLPAACRPPTSDDKGVSKIDTVEFILSSVW